MSSINKKLRYKNGKPNLVIARVKEPMEQVIKPYRVSYLDFSKLAASKFNIYYAYTHLGQGVFKNGYIFKNGRYLPFHDKIYARVIFNKRRLHVNGGRDWQVINKYKLYKISFNKYRSYQLFKKYMKPTYRIHNKTEFNKFIKKISTANAVFKPVFGAGGENIKIGPKNSLARRIKKFNGLLQEFVDTTKGIPGICKSLHDIRILIMSGKIVQTYVRIPKKGSYLSNIARGGRMLEITKKQTPASIKKIALDIDRRFFKKFGPRIYSIDFGFEKDKPYLFEMNPQPGLPYKQWKMYYRAWHKELLKTLLSAIK